MASFKKRRLKKVDYATIFQTKIIENTICTSIPKRES